MHTNRKCFVCLKGNTVLTDKLLGIQRNASASEVKVSTTDLFPENYLDNAVILC